MSQYIPDITERFPEGYGGVDMTPSYFGEPVDWTQAYGYEEVDDGISIPMETEPNKFIEGNIYTRYGMYGGITYYKVEAIDKVNRKILMSEIWEDIDGSGRRPAQWHDLSEDENGNERAFEYRSQTFGDVYIYA